MANLAVVVDDDYVGDGDLRMVMMMLAMMLMILEILLVGKLCKTLASIMANLVFFLVV